MEGRYKGKDEHDADTRRAMRRQLTVTLRKNSREKRSLVCRQGWTADDENADDYAAASAAAAAVAAASTVDMDYSGGQESEEMCEHYVDGGDDAGDFDEHFGGDYGGDDDGGDDGDGDDGGDDAGDFDEYSGGDDDGDDGGDIIRLPGAHNSTGVYFSHIVQVNGHHMAEIWTRRLEDDDERNAAIVQRMKIVSERQEKWLSGAVILELITNGWMQRLQEMALFDGHPQRHDALWVLCRLVSMNACAEIILMCRLSFVDVFATVMFASDVDAAALGLHSLANLMNDKSYAVAEFAAGAARQVLHLWCQSSNTEMLELCTYFMTGLVEKKSRQDFDGQPVLCTLPIETVLLPAVSLMSLHFETVILPQLGVMLEAADSKSKHVIAKMCCGALQVIATYLKLWANVLLDQQTVLNHIALAMPAVRLMQQAELWMHMLASEWDSVVVHAAHVIDCVIDQPHEPVFSIAPNPDAASKYASMYARVVSQGLQGTPVELLNLEHNVFHHVNACMHVMVINSARFSTEDKKCMLSVLSNIALDSPCAAVLAMQANAFRFMVELCRQSRLPELWDMVAMIFADAARTCRSEIRGLSFHFAMELEMLPTMASFVNRYAHHSPVTTRACISFFVQLMSEPRVGDDVKNALKDRLRDMNVADTLGRIQTTGRSQELVGEATTLLRFIEDDDDDDFIDEDTKLMLLD